VGDPDGTNSTLFVVSGAPGSGKTEVLGRLRGDITIVHEPARAILAEQRASGGLGTWDQDTALFVRLILQRAIADHDRSSRRIGVSVFDRGIPDCVVYANRAGLDPGPSLAATERYRYERRVLFFEPWPEIYTTDDERTLTFEGAAAFGEELRDVYRRSGYEVVPVARGSVPERVAFVDRAIRSAV
jgi:predicted ATPase